MLIVDPTLVAAEDQRIIDRLTGPLASITPTLGDAILRGDGVRIGVRRSERRSSSRIARSPAM